MRLLSEAMALLITSYLWQSSRKPRLMLVKNSSTATPSPLKPKSSVGSDVGFSLETIPNVAGTIDSMLSRRTNAYLAAGKSANQREMAAPPTFTDQDKDSASLAGIVDFPLPTRSRQTPSFHALQEWEGYVVEINDADFTARLTDLTAGASYAGEEADIPLEEVSESDAARMQVGSIFRWVIGYERSPSGTKKRVSQIVFRDLPAVTKADLLAGEEWAGQIVGAFGQ